MTKPLDPEVKSLYAIARELEKHDAETQERMMAYFWAKVNDTTQDQVRRGLALVRRMSAA